MVVALSLSPAGRAQEPRTGPPPTLDAAIRAVDGESPAQWLSDGLPQLVSALRDTPETDADYPWALKLEAEILRNAGRLQGVFGLCERAQSLNRSLIAKAHSNAAGGEQEILARRVAVSIWHEEVELWLSLGAVDRVAEALGQEETEIVDLRGLVPDPKDLIDELYVNGFDACHLALAQERTADALENCRMLRSMFSRSDLPSGADRLLEIDLLEATAQHDRSLEGRLDPSIASEHLLGIADRASAPPDLVHEALLLLVELDLARSHWPDARTHLDRIHGLEIATATEPGALSLPLENSTRVCAFEGCLALGTRAPRGELASRRDALSQAIETILQNWRELPPQPAGLGVLLWGTQRLSLAVLIDLELALDEGEQGAVRALDVVLRAQAVGTLARRMGYESVAISDFQRELLDERTGCLLYLPSTDRTHLFVITRDRVDRPRVLASQDALQDVLDPWLAVAAAPPNDTTDPHEMSERLHAFEDLGARAREKLLPEDLLHEMASWKNVFVIGAEMLRKFPFEKLPLQDGTPSSVRWAVVRLPSLPVGICLSRRHDARSGKMLLLAATEPSASEMHRWPQLGVLDLSTSDVEALCAGLTPESCPRYVGASAALTPAVRASLATSTLGVVLGHGIWDERAERPPAIVLAADEGSVAVLGCDEIEALDRAPSVVELLGCGSGRGRMRFGDDSNSLLAASLFLRGTDSVLEASTDVGLRSTIAFASAVNERMLSAGECLAEAVRAVRESRWRNAATHDPSDWGSLVVEGLGFRPEFARPVRVPEAIPALSGNGGGLHPRAVWIMSVIGLGSLLAIVWALRTRRRRCRRQRGSA